MLFRSTEFPLHGRTSHIPLKEDWHLGFQIYSRESNN